MPTVYSLGTEDRRPANEYLPANPKPYDYIVFRATEVKDLVVERRAEDMRAAMLAGSRSVQDDPAVIGASTGSPAVANPGVAEQVAPSQGQTTPQAPVAATVPDTLDVAPEAAAAAPESTDGASKANGQRTGNGTRPQQSRTTSRDGGIRSAEVAVESVERAMGALRVGGGATTNAGGTQSSGARRGGRRTGGIKGPGVVPETPFDFLRANAKFDKNALIPEMAAQQQLPESPVGEQETPASGADTPQSPGGSVAGKGTSTYYDRSKSFFDDISSDSKTRTEEERTGVRMGGPAMARQRREEERNRNLSTFGETGMGGWGGRGGGQGRRGGRRRGGGRQQ
ncbi:hypothetical protein FRB99_005921 [Tulasnella sp. 403]|nr:hypothetical protein FRB99_005921 [Tulasnella sp. 403]